MARKGLTEGLTENIPDLEKPCLICSMTKETKINRYPTTSVSNTPPCFMLQMDFTSLNVEIIRGFTSTFVAICFANSYHFGFSSRSKYPPLGILKCIVNTLGNYYKGVSFTQFDGDRALERSSEFMKTCHNMNRIVQNTGRDAYYLNGKIESPNKTLANIKKYLILN